MMLQDKPALAKRLARVIVGLNLVLVVTGMALNLRFPTPADAEYGPLFPWPLSSLIYGVLALLIIARHPRHTVGWLFVLESFFMGLTALSLYGSFGLEQLFGVDTQPDNVPLRLLGESIWILALFLPITFILQFFPDGRLPSRRWWPIPFAVILGILSQLVGFVPEVIGLTESEGAYALLEPLSTLFMVIGIVGSLAAVVVRFLRSQGVERLQMKWLVYTAVVGISLAFLSTLLLGPESPINAVFFTSLPSLLAVAIGIAILRYRLFDIDIIIRRTLQYALLTGVLALSYFGGVALLQNGFRFFTGRSNSPIVTVVTTLGIAGMFNPLRHRVQEFIDRRFYRPKYDAQRALSRFSAAAREEVDLERLSGELIGIVEETIKPERVRLWLRPPQGGS